MNLGEDFSKKVAEWERIKEQTYLNPAAEVWKTLTFSNIKTVYKFKIFFISVRMKDRGRKKDKNIKKWFRKICKK